MSLATPATPVIASGPRRWIEPWYAAYALLGALASGFAAILIPLVVTRSGGTASQIGAAIAAQNLGALFAPLWGSLADSRKAYRPVFFGGFLLIAAGFACFALLSGVVAWFGAAFLIGFGTAASNTVASLFVVEFRPKSEWRQRISWLQTFNAAGSVLGMAVSGLLAPRLGMGVSAGLAVLAILVGQVGLPVPRSHAPPKPLKGVEIAALARRGGPSAAMLHQHRWRWPDLLRLWRAADSPFALFLAGWFGFSLAVSAVGSLYPVLMQSSFAVPPGVSAAVLSAATAVSLVLYNFAGHLDAKRGSASVLRIGYVVRAAALGGLALLAFTHVPSGAAVAIVLYALFQGVWPLLSVARTTRRPRWLRSGKARRWGCSTPRPRSGRPSGRSWAGRSRTSSAMRRCWRWVRRGWHRPFSPCGDCSERAGGDHRVRLFGARMTGWNTRPASQLELPRVTQETADLIRRRCGSVGPGGARMPPRGRGSDQLGPARVANKKIDLIGGN